MLVSTDVRVLTLQSTGTSKIYILNDQPARNTPSGAKYARNAGRETARETARKTARDT